MAPAAKSITSRPARRMAPRPRQPRQLRRLRIGTSCTFFSLGWLFMAFLLDLTAAHRGQFQAQVAQSGDDPIERGLIWDCPSKQRLILAGMADGQAAKPFRPFFVDLSLDVDLNFL